jgi:hypothetical protein
MTVCLLESRASLLYSVAAVYHTTEFHNPFEKGTTMKRILLSLALGLSLAGAVFAEDTIPPKTHPDSSAWQDLFAKDLSNAIFPKDIWTVEDGVLTASEDKVIWTEKKYGDFVLDLEFKNGPGANSGVFLHCSDTNDFIPNSVEVQIADPTSEKWQKAPPSWHCGAMFGHKPAAKQVCKGPGEWNRMTITAKGKMIYVLLNGEPVNEMDMTQYTSAKTNPDGSEVPSWLSKPVAGLEHMGHVGLQGKHGGAPIYFRNLKIKPLD